MDSGSLFSVIWFVRFTCDLIPLDAAVGCVSAVNLASAEGLMDKQGC